MDKSLSSLGLEEIIAALVARANTAGGKTITSAITPASSPDEAERALEETFLMAALMEERPDFDIEPCEDITGLVGKARKSQALTGVELRAFVPVLRAGEKVQTVFRESNIEEGNPLWAPIPPVHGLGELVDESIDEEGQVRHDATPEIERLYKNVNSLRRSIREKAESLLKDKGLADMLQDEYVTLRDNRFVLPIKAEHKSHVEGIVHDSSNSGQTFFIEPKALVDLNNRLRTAEMELADEIARLLADLSRMIAEEADSIESIYGAITRLDFISAKARLARGLGCSRPVFGERLELKGAVNPIMPLGGKKAVANDITIPEGGRVLMISGPNTGGKTVAMKTIGLLSLMAKMGLFVTAEEGSRIPFYGSIFADIGDSQSITADLSTFSAHLVAINAILERAGRGSLALLDELMVSTDPKEGSALAIAVLDRLVEKGVDVVVTTHFQELKLLAQSQPGYFNVSMEFDHREARPTYRMVSGVPGSSSALAVAERLGMDRKVIAAAKTRLEGGDQRIEEALSDLARRKSETEKARREAQAALKEAERMRAESERIRGEMEEMRKELAKTAKRKLSSDITAARREISGLVEDIKAAEDKRAAAKMAREKLAGMEAEAREAGAPEERVPRDRLKEGDEVYVTPLEKRGRLASTPFEGKAEVIVGGMRVAVGIENIIGLGAPAPAKDDYAKRLRPSQTEAPAPKEKAELDIRGERAEEAIEKVEKFLDTMFNSGKERARIIHGKGTGALRAAVREHLSVSPYVAGFETAEPREGGDGVTVVVFRD